MDPHPIYDAMRRIGPAWWDEATACWYVTTYDDVSSLLRDRRLSARIGASFGGANAGPAADVLEFFEAWPMFTDPPQHAVMRQRVTTQYRPSAFRPLRDGVARTAADLLRECNPSNADLLAEFVQPLAVAVTCDLLGIPVERRADLLQWSADIIAFIGVPVLDADRAPRAREAIANLALYLRTVAQTSVERGEATPQLQALMSLPDREAQALFAQILTGGIEPVVGCLGGAVTHLVGDGRDLAAEVAACQIDPARVTEEALRFDAPFHFVPRTALADLQVGDQRIVAGDRVALVVAAAHRDPMRHHDPGRFRVPPLDRPDPAHLAFGAGAHYCLGAGLARITITEAIMAAARWADSNAVRRLEVRRDPAFGHTVWSRLGVGY